MKQRLPLTKRNIDRIPFTAKGQVTYWDTDMPGFGLLVGKRSKTFLVQVDVKDATKPKGYRTVKKTIGRYGDLTPEEARKMVGGREEEKNGKRVFTPGKRLELKRGTINKGCKVTLQEMLKAYFSEKKTKSGYDYKASTTKGATAIIERQFSTWLPLTLPEISNVPPDAVIDRYKQIEAASGPYAARNAFTILRAIITYAMVKYPAAIDKNPFSILTLPGMNIVKRIKVRDECLQGNDFKQFYERIQSFNEVIRDGYLFCLYHGMRRDETESLRWEYINFENKEIYIPDTKNRRPLHIPLSRQSFEILKRRKNQAIEDNPWVFPTVREDIGKTGHIMLMPAVLKSRTGLNITVHGLRRTFITIGRKLKLHIDVDRLTNHIDSSVSGKHYDQTDVDDLRKPLQVITNEIERLMKEGAGAKVINLA